MTAPDDIRADLEPGLAPPEIDALVAMAERLRVERPVPRAAFRGDLRRRLLATHAEPTRRARPARLRLLVSVYLGSGAALLLLAGAGLAGAGPFTA